MANNKRPCACILSILLLYANLVKSQYCFDAYEYVLKETGFGTSDMGGAKAQSVEQCMVLCVRVKQCESINYNLETNVCQLNDNFRSGRQTVSYDNLYSEFRWWPSEVDKNCFSRPCKGNEVCIPGNLLAATSTNGCSYGCMPNGGEPVCPLPKKGVSHGRTVGSVNVVKCREGWIGGGNATCMKNEEWDKDIDECVEIHNYKCENDSLCTQIGAECIDGKCQCLSTHMYDENSFKCKEKSVCESLPSIQNGIATLDNDNQMSYLDTATVNCDEGHDTIKTSIKCQANGQWETSECEKKVCGSLPSVQNGTVTLDNDNQMSYLDTATVNCDEGHGTIKTSIKCQANGQWETSECEKKVCESLPSVQNGTVTLDNDNQMSYLDTATVNCDEGHGTIKTSIKCQANGQWETSECEKKVIDMTVCGSLPSVQNGTVTLDNDNQMSYLDTATVNCDEGHHTIKTSIKCKANGQWETSECEKKVCGSLPSIQNGTATLDNDNQMSYLDTATVNCDEGHETIKTSIKCQANGQWETSVCEKKVCGSLPVITGGSATLDNAGQMSYLDTAKVICDDGYKSDYESIKCETNGKWESPTCNKLAPPPTSGDKERSCQHFRGAAIIAFWMLTKCGEPSVPNGDATLDSENQMSYLDTATVNCDEWYATVKTSIKCQANGQWETSACKMKEDVYKFDARFYRFIQQQKNWYEAEESCDQQNGHLVDIKSQAENDFITETITTLNSTVCYWIGGRRIDFHEFVWFDGSAFTNGYTNWFPGEPNPSSFPGNCVQTVKSDDYMWKRVMCFKSCHFICEFI